VANPAGVDPGATTACGKNQLCLCAAHHLHGIHEGLMRVTGTAPDELTWEFGLCRSWAATAVP